MDKRLGLVLAVLMACGGSVDCDEPHGYVTIDHDTCGLTAPQTWSTPDDVLDAAMAGEWSSTPLDTCGVRTARSRTRAADLVTHDDGFTLFVVDGSWGVSGCGDLHDCEARALEGATTCVVEGRFSGH